MSNARQLVTKLSESGVHGMFIYYNLFPDIAAKLTSAYGMQAEGLLPRTHEAFVLSRDHSETWQFFCAEQAGSEQVGFLLFTKHLMPMRVHTWTNFNVAS